MSLEIVPLRERAMSQATKAWPRVKKLIADKIEALVRR
jgi:hypothetical protein